VGGGEEDADVEGVGGVAGGVDGVAAGGITGRTAVSALATTAASIPAPLRATSRTACSDHGSLTALGPVRVIASPGRCGAAGGAAATGARESPAASGGALRNGVTVVPDAAALPATAAVSLPGAVSRNDCPTRITLLFSMPFHAASSRQSSP